MASNALLASKASLSSPVRLAWEPFLVSDACSALEALQASQLRLVLSLVFQFSCR